MRASRVFVATIIVVSGAVASANSAGAAGPATSQLSDVACPSAGSCFAVGSKTVGSVEKTLIERWNGASWSIVASPNAVGGSGLSGVACASTSSCFAVGHADVSGGFRAYIARGNGSAWSTSPTPTIPGAAFVSLESVACSSASNCFAVGAFGSSFFVSKTLVERWNGSAWSVVASPNVAGSTNSALSGATCASASRCFATGFSASTNSWASIIEIWNGTKWAISPTPTVANFPNLSGVACRSANRCFAVGAAEGASDETVVQRWDGATWSNLASPQPGGDNGRSFSDISCPSGTTSCFAVGFSDEFVGTTRSTLIERWDGAHWTVFVTPNVGTDSNELDGVTCASATACFAVGSSGNFGASLIERWNGKAWALSAHPQPAS